MSSSNRTYTSEPSEEEPYEEFPEETHSMTPVTNVASNSNDWMSSQSSQEETEEEDSTAREPERERSFTSYRSQPNGRLMKFTHRKKVRIPRPSLALKDDPYRPPRFFPLPEQTNLDRWLWIRDTLGYWRSQERSPYTMTDLLTSTAPICQVTGEPTHHTIPLLIARAYRHEADIELLQHHMSAMPDFHMNEMPDPNQWEEMRHDLSTVQLECQTLRCDFEQAGVERSKVAWLESRLLTVENGLSQLQASMNALHESIAYLFKEQAESSKKNDH